MELSLLTNQLGTNIFSKKLFLLEVLSCSLQLFWSKTILFIWHIHRHGDKGFYRRITASTSSGRRRGYTDSTENWEATACKHWPSRSLFIRGGIIREVLLPSCLESSGAQAASEHNWLCCSHRTMWWLLVTLRAVLSPEWTAPATWS